MQQIVDRVIGSLKPGWVHPRVKVRSRAVRPGADVQATLLLRPEGRGGRFRDAVVEVVVDSDVVDTPEKVVLAGRLDQIFDVRPGVEVAFPFSLELPRDLGPSGLGARYRLRVRGRTGLRRVHAEESLVVLPAEDAGLLHAIA
jgi:hypothetical protein